VLVGAGVAVDRERKEGGREEGREGEWSFTTFSSMFEMCCRGLGWEGRGVVVERWLRLEKR